MVKMRPIYFWILSYTWGIIMTLIGTIAAIALIITKHKPKTLGPCIYFKIGYGWGIVSLGPFLIMGKDCGSIEGKHEFGHCIQNSILGPFMIFLIIIPCILRSCIRRWKLHDDRLCFLTVTTIFLLVSIATPLAIVARYSYNLILIYLATGWALYLKILSVWQLSEIKKYYYSELDEPYDSIWFERWATRLGNIYLGEL